MKLVLSILALCCYASGSSSTMVDAATTTKVANRTITHAANANAKNPTVHLRGSNETGVVDVGRRELGSACTSQGDCQWNEFCDLHPVTRQNGNGYQTCKPKRHNEDWCWLDPSTNGDKSWCLSHNCKANGQGHTLCAGTSCTSQDDCQWGEFCDLHPVSQQNGNGYQTCKNKRPVGSWCWSDPEKASGSSSWCHSHNCQANAQGHTVCAETSCTSQADCQWTEFCDLHPTSQQNGNGYQTCKPKRPGNSWCWSDASTVGDASWCSSFQCGADQRCAESRVCHCPWSGDKALKPDSPDGCVMLDSNGGDSTNWRPTCGDAGQTKWRCEPHPMGGQQIKMFTSVTGEGRFLRAKNIYAVDLVQWNEGWERWCVFDIGNNRFAIESLERPGRYVYGHNSEVKLVGHVMDYESWRAE